MEGILKVILSVVALLLLGAFATFFAILNIYKRQMWENINERYFKNGKK